VNDPVDSSLFVVATLRVPLTKSPKVDDVAHRDFHSPQRFALGATTLIPLGTAKRVSQNQRYFLSPRNTRFVDCGRTFQRDLLVSLYIKG
jgi:hypothetical protein